MPTIDLAPLRRALPVGTALAAVSLAFGAAGAHAAPEPPATAHARQSARPALPGPGGGPVGTAVVRLVDRSRRDPWTHAGPRELALTAFYPARRAPRTPGHWMSPASAGAFAAAIGVEAAPLQALRTHAGTGAVPRRGRRPVVIVAPGAANPRASVTLVAEALAAHGYVALAIDHPGDGAVVELSGGRIRPLDPAFLAGLADASSIPKAVRVRRDDIRFLLDRLPALDRRGPLRGLLDPTRVAMAGHSIGGSVAANVMLADRRVDVGVNYDGMYFLAADRRPVTRPFLTMTGVADATAAPFLARQRGPGMLVNLAGAEHESFTDYAFIAPLVSGGALPVEFGTLPAADALAAQLAYTRAFLDHHLRGRRAGDLLTQRTSRRYPSATAEFARAGG